MPKLRAAVFMIDDAVATGFVACARAAGWLPPYGGLTSVGGEPGWQPRQHIAADQWGGSDGPARGSSTARVAVSPFGPWSPRKPWRNRIASIRFACTPLCAGSYAYLRNRARTPSGI